ncbi:MAG TPA: four helix bundle protein [Candidatus Sulfotelmatobacter sp.]
MVPEVSRGETYRDWMAWPGGMKLVTAIYRATQAFSRGELYGLTSQLRRAAVLVPSNIAEGQARFSPKEFLRSLTVARGSLVEVETEILIAPSLGVAADGAEPTVACGGGRTRPYPQWFDCLN